MENKYIRLLKQARKDFESNEKIDFDDFEKRLGELGIETDSKSLWRQIYNPGDSNLDFQVMGLEAYFQLLEYEELNEARESSVKASRQARNAIIIAIITLITSIAFSIWQISKPVQIDQEQINSINKRIESLEKSD